MKEIEEAKAKYTEEARQKYGLQFFDKWLPVFSL